MIYKALYYRLYKAIDELGGKDITLRTNGLLSFIISLNFAFAIAIIEKITGFELKYVEITMAVFLAGIFILNYLLFTRKKRYIRIFEELEMHNSNIGFKSKIVVTIAIVLTVTIATVAIII